MFGIGKENSIEFNRYLMLLKNGNIYLKMLMFSTINSKHTATVKQRFVITIL